MADDELRWEPPGPGQWYASAEHMPRPGCTLLVELLPPVAAGWGTGAARYGLPPRASAFGASHRWFFFSPGQAEPPDAAGWAELEQRAADTLATRRWRTELQRWQEVTRPAMVAAHRGFLATDLPALDDAALAAHVRAVVDHWRDAAPQHFAAIEGAAAIGWLLTATNAWGLDPTAALLALAGSASASSSVEGLLQRIADGVRAAGLDAPSSLDEVRALGGDAAAALGELLVDQGWKVFHTDLLEPTLAERPQAVLVGVRAAMVGWGGRRRPDPTTAVAALREQVPEADRADFDDRFADAWGTYGHNDDNSTVLFAVPLGLVRRAVLEVGRRLHAAGRLEAAGDAFEATVAELGALLAGGGPSAGTLAARSAELRAMAAVRPPAAVGTPLPPAPPLDLPPAVRQLDDVVNAFQAVAWAARSEGGRAAVTVGTEVVRGRAVVVVDPLEALERMEPGDVLVAVSTTASFNAIFPVAGAVAVQEGGTMSHPAVLARELGLTAVIGVPDLLTRVAEGDWVEVDPVAGLIRVVEEGR